MALVIEKLHQTMYTHFLHFLFDFIQYMCVPHTSPPCRLTTCKQTIQPYYYIKQRSNLFTVICPDNFFFRAKSHSFMNCLENRSHLRILNCRICKFNLHKHAYMRNTHKKTADCACTSELSLYAKSSWALLFLIVQYQKIFTDFIVSLSNSFESRLSPKNVRQGLILIILSRT